MKITLAGDYHSPALREAVASAWKHNKFLVVCPPGMSDRSFTDALESTRFPEPPVLGVFTSGTLSSSPRLVVYSRRNIEASLDAIHGLFELKRIEHLFCYPQAFHTFGLTLGYVAALMRGWRLHTPLGKYGSHAHAARVDLREENTLTLGTPTHFYDLLKFAREQRKFPAPSYSCIMGGASVMQKLWLDVKNDLGIEAPSVGYGCTEASPGIAHLPPGYAPEADGEIGYPLKSLESKVLKRGVRIAGEGLCMAVVQDDQVEFPGELVIRDQIEIDARGSWHFHGRLDLTLNRGGMKYSLEAIERELSHAARRTVVAAAVKDQRLGEDLAVAIVGSDDGVGTELENILRSRWNLRLEPRRLKFVPELPLNECAKLDRRRLARDLT